MANDHIVALTTTPSQEEGEKLARELVDSRLAACVQLTPPIRAIYRWKGEVYNEPEWQLWIKTAADKVDELMKWLPEHHSGEVPELVVLPIIGGWGPYLDWITEETR